MKTSEALSIVLREFETNDRCSEFICVSAEDLRRKGLITGAACMRIRDHIQALLGGEVTLVSWLRNKRRIRINHADPDAEEKMHTTRVAWLKDMIAHFKRKGD